MDRSRLCGTAVPRGRSNLVQHALFSAQRGSLEGGSVSVFELLKSLRAALGFGVFRASLGCFRLRAGGQGVKLGQHALRRSTSGRDRQQGGGTAGVSGGLSQFLTSSGPAGPQGCGPGVGTGQSTGGGVLLRLAQAQEPGQGELTVHAAPSRLVERRKSSGQDSLYGVDSSMLCRRNPLMAASWSSAASTKGLLPRW